MWTHVVQHVDIRSLTCGHMYFYMWTHVSTSHVDTRAFICGHMQYTCGHGTADACVHISYVHVDTRKVTCGHMQHTCGHGTASACVHMFALHVDTRNAYAMYMCPHVYLHMSTCSPRVHVDTCIIHVLLLHVSTCKGYMWTHVTLHVERRPVLTRCRHM